MAVGERGALMTVVCEMNALWKYTPAMFIFPSGKALWKRMQPGLMVGTPPPSVGFCSPNGWMDNDLFLKWLEHFVVFTNATKELPQIIVFDGHHNHKTLAAVTYAKERDIHMITLPSHWNHRMQPLDRTFLKSLKNNYNWMVSIPSVQTSESANVASGAVQCIDLSVGPPATNNTGIAAMLFQACEDADSKDDGSVE
ncbi:hypothetical protein LSH36_151g06022 [Paralvinella palmiformis]|uniref:DDE-1 domain-containing protein n=1 Tax=Paralvinella palmiformis TaxID=53620 RepID=A0AAD9JUU3_9ANNE|nr:hypothetical protein LSH36_151g06022 [Paralvinella palmiformis]